MDSLREKIAAFLNRLFGKKPGKSGRILCDDCKYNYGNACTRPERPNATECPDYKRTGK